MAHNLFESTGTYTVGNAVAVDVTAHTVCRRIVVQEDIDSAAPPTQDLEYAQPKGATPINVSMGLPAVFTPPGGKGAFYPRQIVGTIRAQAGSITAQQIESAEI